MTRIIAVCATTLAEQMRFVDLETVTRALSMLGGVFVLIMMEAVIMSAGT